jgi:hypothetical protein
MPTFSKKISNCLQNGDIWLNNSERSQLVTELAVFYSTSAIILQKQCHYKAVILTLFSKYNKFKEAIISIADSENKLVDNHVCAPRLYLNKGYLYVVVSNEIISEFDSFIDAFYYLFGLYFVYDLKYPECFSQIMGFFHEFIFQGFVNADVQRNTGYMNIVSLINKKT